MNTGQRSWLRTTVLSISGRFLVDFWRHYPSISLESLVNFFRELTLLVKLLMRRFPPYFSDDFFRELVNFFRELVDFFTVCSILFSKLLMRRFPP
eukprot:g8910.t1